MAQSLREELQRSGKKRIVAVVGAGHLPGIERELLDGSQVDLQSLSSLPRRRRWLEILKWVLSGALLLVVSAVLFFRGEADRLEQIRQALLWWAGLRALGGGLGALLTGVRPLNALITAALAPVSFFLGFAGIRLSMITALLQLRSHKPSVEDFERIALETSSFGGFVRALYTNPVLNLAYLFLGVGWGVALASLAFFSVILPRLGGG